MVLADLIFQDVVIEIVARNCVCIGYSTSYYLDLKLMRGYLLKYAQMECR